MAEYTVVYFCHGVPGGPDDVDLLATGDTDVIAPSLFHDSVFAPLPQFDALTEGMPDRSVHVVGFSIGAMAAIQIAGEFAERVGKLTLISPAAPLQLGDFLPDMAGRPVFQIAQRSPFGLRALTFAQGLLMRTVPKTLINQLFGAAEAELRASPDFQKALKAGLRNSLCHHPAAYAQSIGAYVGRWDLDLEFVRCPTEIWHGDADTWAPIEMSEALVPALPNGALLHRVAGGEHYTTLTKTVLSFQTDDFPL